MQEATKLERSIFYSFLLLLFCLPIPLGSNRPWAWSIMEFVIACQTLSLVWVYRKQMPWQRIAVGKVLLAALLLFQLWTLIQSLPLPVDWVLALSPKSEELQLAFIRALGIQPETLTLSLDLEQTRISLVKGLSYCLLAFNCFLLINSAERLRSLLIVLVISGTFQAFYGAMLILSELELSPIFKFEIGNVATGSYIYKNHFANYLLLSLSMGLGLIVSDLQTRRSGSWRVRTVRLLESMLSTKMLVRLCLVIMVIGLVMSRSRMGNSAFFISTLVTGVLALFIYKNRPKALSYLVASILIIDTFIVSTLFGLDKVRERLEATVLAEEERLSIFDTAIQIIWDFPLFGTGAGSFYAVFQHYLDGPHPGFYDHSHNDYLQFAIEYGLVATVMLGLAVLFVLWQCIVTMKKRNSSLMKGTALGCFMAILAMLIHISVDFNLQAPANAATFIVLLCIALIVTKLPVTMRDKE